jgi:hypothetical protein
VAIRGVSDSFQYFATIVLSIQVTIIGLCFTGPVFNTQLGIEFWTITAALFGAAQAWQEGGGEDREDKEDGVQAEEQPRVGVGPHEQQGKAKDEHR